MISTSFFLDSEFEAFGKMFLLYLYMTNIILLSYFTVSRARLSEACRFALQKAGDKFATVTTKVSIQPLPTIAANIKIVTSCLCSRLGLLQQSTF